MKLTADVCDKNEDEIDNGSVQVLSIPLNMYRQTYFGQVATVKAFEDNSFIEKTFEEDGENRILVVDGGVVEDALDGRKLSSFG